MSTQQSTRRSRILHGDCLDLLPEQSPASVHAVVTDPPYGIGFQGLAWDGRKIAQAAARSERRGTLGPVSRGGDSPGRRRPRTTSAFGCAAAHAGSYDFTPSGKRAYGAWCARWAGECLRVLKPGGHLASFAHPRTVHHLALALEDAGFELRDTLLWLFGQGFPKSHNLHGRWQGWGTTLKPAYEPILLARKPLTGTTKQNIDTHGTGALNIDACRLAPDGADRPQPARWPPNVILSHHPRCRRACNAECPLALLNTQTAGRTATAASRFFYCAKITRRERDAGCHGVSRRTIQTFAIGRHNERANARAPVANPHPTVKPLALMRWLCRLVTPPDGLILDPFAGSGSTGCAAALEGFRSLGIERDPVYIKTARARIAHWSAQANAHRSQPS